MPLLQRKINFQFLQFWGFRLPLVFVFFFKPSVCWGSKTASPNCLGHVSISSFRRIQGRNAWPHRRQYCSLTAASVKAVWGAPFVPLVKKSWISLKSWLSGYVWGGRLTSQGRLTIAIIFLVISLQNTGGFKHVESTWGPDPMWFWLCYNFLRRVVQPPSFPKKKPHGMYPIFVASIWQRHKTVKSQWILETHSPWKLRRKPENHALKREIIFQTSIIVCIFLSGVYDIWAMYALWTLQFTVSTLHFYPKTESAPRPTENENTTAKKPVRKCSKIFKNEVPHKLHKQQFIMIYWSS